MSDNPSNRNQAYSRKLESLLEWRNKRLQDQLQKQQQDTEHQDQSEDFHPNSSQQQSIQVEPIGQLFGEQIENLQEEQNQQHDVLEYMAERLENHQNEQTQQNNVLRNKILELQGQLRRTFANCKKEKDDEANNSD